MIAQFGTTVRGVEKFFIELHELMCKEYGFIDAETFESLPMPMVLNFLEIIKKRAKEMELASKVR